MRGARGLRLQHAQRVRQRGHAFPAQFQVVVQAAADQVQVRIVEAGDGGAPIQVDEPAVRRAVAHDVAGAADGQELAVADGDRIGPGLLRIARVKAAVEEDQCRRCIHERAPEK